MLGIRGTKFAHAAIAYLTYGFLYEGFALFRVWQGGVPPDVSSSRMAIYLTAGALIMVLFPYLIYRGYRWFSRLVAVLVGFRVIALVAVLSGFQLSYFYGWEPFFRNQMSSDLVYATALLVTLATFFFLVRAGWDLERLERK